MTPVKKQTKAAAKGKPAAKARALKPKVVNVGVVGLSMGGHHVKSFADHPRAKVVGLCDLNLERAHALAKEHGVSFVTDDYKALLARRGLDAVCIATPNYLHTPIAIAAFKAGKHVACEKPLAMTPVEAAQMVSAAKQAGRLLMVAVNNRYRGDVQVLKQFIEAGELGKIYFAKAGWMRRHGCPMGWFGVKAHSGGGPLIDLGVHQLDLAWYLMGCPEPVAAFGSAYREIGRRGQRGGWGVGPKGVPFDVEDLAIGMVKFKEGQTLLVEVSWATYIKGDYGWMELMGTEGGASLSPELRIYKDMHGTEVDLLPKTSGGNSHTAEMHHFIECILSGKEPISPGTQGMQVTQMLDGIYRSAETGKSVHF